MLALRDFPILDLTALDSHQLDEAAKLFEAMGERALLPLHQMDEDAVRRDLDSEFAGSILGLPAGIVAGGGPLELLRVKLARDFDILSPEGQNGEPSIRGHEAWCVIPWASAPLDGD